MKWLWYVSFFIVGLGVAMNLEHFVEDIAFEEETHFARKPKIPRSMQKRATASAEVDYGIPDPAVRTVLRALARNSPHGRSWEHLPQDEFAAEVENWVDEILEEAGLDVSDKDALMVGSHFNRKDDPYLRYLGLTLMYRSGPEKEMQIGLLWHLANHPHFGDYYIDDKASASHERMVRHKLIVELTERYGQKIVSDLRNDSTEEEFFEIRSRFKNAYEKKILSKKIDLGLMKVDEILDNID